MDLGNDIYTIHHVESLRRRASFYWPDIRYHRYTNPHRNPYDFRPALNVRALTSLLFPNEEVVSDDEEPAEGNKFLTGSGTLHKRKRSESATPGPSKRVRLSTPPALQNDDAEQDETNQDQDDTHRQIYPSYWESLTPSDVIGEVYQTEGTSFLQVHQFGLNLQYNRVVDHGSNHYADDNVATEWGWFKEEERLCSLLRARPSQRDVSLSRDIDIGRFFVTRYHGRLLALSEPLEVEPPSPWMIKEHSERWLFLLPDIPWPDGIAEYNLGEQDMKSSGVHRDFITACAALQSHRRLKLEANLQLHILPEGTYDPLRDFPFELRAHFVLSLAIPGTYYPFDNALSRSKADELEGLQRRLICCLSKTPLVRPAHGIDDATGEATDVTIPFFLNVMRPAPPLAQDVTYELLQPDGLLPTLMPFQRRTVAWMLAREGKRMSHAGTVVPLDVSEASSSEANRHLPLFWEEIELGSQSFFFNRLTSALSPTFPEPHTMALGGILAEEPGWFLSCNLCDGEFTAGLLPGLGKTMECLSLVLLNPAPKRNPSNERWDPEAQLNVKEIKVTFSLAHPQVC